MVNLKDVPFTFVCPDRAYSDAVFREFAGETNWEYRVGVFEDIGWCDTMITAGNSYGIMDGGLDKAVRDYFGGGVQAVVQTAIAKQHSGVLPPGTSVTVPVSKGDYTRLIYAPTMRKPMDIRDTNFVFYAALAAFNAVLALPENPLGVVVPAFGSVTGKVSPKSMAAQLHAAWIQATTKYVFTTWQDVAVLESTIVVDGY